jgi:hypothetical protein
MSCYRGLASDQKAVDGAGCYHFCYHIPVYGQGLETIAARSSSSPPQLPEFIAVASSYPHGFADSFGCNSGKEAARRCNSFGVVAETDLQSVLDPRL